jgi:hypothetical protein
MAVNAAFLAMRAFQIRLKPVIDKLLHRIPRASFAYRIDQFAGLRGRQFLNKFCQMPFEFAVLHDRPPLMRTNQEHKSRSISILNANRAKGIGPEFAAVLWSEGLSRKFDNRRQVAAYAGLAPTPWQSGQIDYEQGVSKSGNPRLRSTLVQVAWLWVRHQPNSALSQWFRNRVTQNGGRYKKTAIIALARKLLVAIWKYVTAGVVIEGAILTTPSA